MSKSKFFEDTDQVCGSGWTSAGSGSNLRGKKTGFGSDLRKKTDPDSTLENNPETDPTEN